MLVPFVIDADSLAFDQSWTSAQQRACHKSLFDVWKRAGLLVHDGDALLDSRLYQAVQSLPQKSRPLWYEVLERTPLLSAPGWNGSVSITTLAQLAGIAKLALVDDTIAEAEFNFDDDCDELVQSIGEHDVLICRLLAAGQSRFFRDAIDLAGVHIELGEAYNDIWDMRFKSLAAAPIKTVSIVDRYAISQHVNCPQTKLSGLGRFLRLLDSDSTGPRNVTIYSAWTKDLSVPRKFTIDDIKADLRLVLGGLVKKNIKRLTVYMVSNVVFRDDAHDRYVRFGDYVWDLGIGLEVFDGPASPRRSTASFNSGTAVSGYKDIERYLAASRQVTRIDIP